MTTAFLAVDVQNAFAEGGSLGVAGGAAAAAALSQHLAERGGSYSLRIASRDWHDPHGTNSGHFAEPGTEPDYQDTWPPHAVADTADAEYHPNFDTSHITHHVRKGQGRPAYSAFEGVDERGRPLLDLLRDAEVDTIDVGGIATEFCDLATVMDARRHGFTVRFHPALAAGVTAHGAERAIQEMERAGVEIVSADADSGPTDHSAVEPAAPDDREAVRR